MRCCFAGCCARAACGQRKEVAAPADPSDELAPFHCWIPSLGRKPNITLGRTSEVTERKRTLDEAAGGMPIAIWSDTEIFPVFLTEDAVAGLLFAPRRSGLDRFG